MDDDGPYCEATDCASVATHISGRMGAVACWCVTHAPEQQRDRLAGLLRELHDWAVSRGHEPIDCVLCWVEKHIDAALGEVTGFSSAVTQNTDENGPDGHGHENED